MQKQKNLFCLCHAFKVFSNSAQFLQKAERSSQIYVHGCYDIIAVEKEKIKSPSQRLGTFIPHKTRLILNCLSDEQYGRILRQLDDYAFEGITPEFDNPMEEGMFGFLKQYDDYDEAHYREIVEKRRIAGKKGAESRWNKAAE